MIVIGGRRYTIADPLRCPRAMVLHLRTILAPTGFDRIEPLPDEALDEFLNRKAETVLPVAAAFLGAMLLPESRSEADWSPVLAKRTTRRLRALDGPTAKEGIEGLARICAARLHDARARLIEAQMRGAVQAQRPTVH
ncbi:MAG: hypothetical protein GEV05_28645 [Betaproteobacteria bacterium]|nr:hypothetical protein [Betaproteobacteria bacterium]